MSDPNKHHVIINGKRYSATTGQILMQDVVPMSRKKKAGPKKINVTNLDPQLDEVITIVEPTPEPVQKVAVRVNPVHAHAVHAHTTRSQTLARQYVKKPTSTPKAEKIIVEHKPIEASAKLHHFAHVPVKRLERASTVSTHPYVRKFETTVNHVIGDIQKTITDLPVRSLPEEVETIMESPIVSSVVQKTEAFAEELEAATSHLLEPIEEKLGLRHRTAKRLGTTPRALTSAATLVVAVVIFGAVLFQNIPKLSVKVAAHRAGIEAVMPGYAPSSFAFAGPVQYKNGQVTIGFASENSQRSYKIEQRATKWTAENLATLYLSAAGKTYQTNDVAGRIVYTYDGSNATWINHGVWYIVTGDAALSTDQLLKIASSI